MRICTTVAEVREARRALPDPLGLVPTMGALHDGHLALVRRARAENASVAVSIFVNPTQFTSADDFGRYPRDTQRDITLLANEGVDLVFLPRVEAVYPTGHSTSVDVGPIARAFEGAARPGHFTGVATVVTMLLNIVQPQTAYFGQKDAQQLAVVSRLVTDLALPVEIVPVPTVRDSDGVALSSRNVLLSPSARSAAAAIPQALADVRAAWESGQRDAAQLREVLHRRLGSEPAITIDYATLVDPASFAECDGTIDGDALVIVAVIAGGVRLIDNWLLPRGSVST